MAFSGRFLILIGNGIAIDFELEIVPDCKLIDESGDVRKIGTDVFDVFDAVVAVDDIWSRRLELLLHTV